MYISVYVINYIIHVIYEYTNNYLYIMFFTLILFTNYYYFILITIEFDR